MADRYPGHMKIGGELRMKAPEGYTQEDWDDQIGIFVNYVTSESVTFNEDTYTAENIEQLASEVNKDGFLTVADCEATEGMFSDLEESCRVLGLSYDRYSSANGVYNADLTRWRPGMDKPYYAMTDENGNVVVSAEDVKGLKDFVLSYLQMGKTDIKPIQGYFDVVLPAEIPELMKFKLIH